jgi:predicted HTH domain antitoxin
MVDDLYPLARKGDTLMNPDAPQTTSKADWLAISEAMLRVGNFPSLDDLLHHALNCWLQQIAPELRWKVAVDLYTTEQVSLGRAAEIAGLNYFVFMEKLRDADIALVDAEVTTKAQKVQQETFINGILDIPRS